MIKIHGRANIIHYLGVISHIVGIAHAILMYTCSLRVIHCVVGVMFV